MPASDYILPQTIIRQLLAVVPGALGNEQRATIIGGNAFLLRCSVPAEKAQGALGAYNPASDTCYSWPGLPAGATVDPSYTQICMDNALLQYFFQPIGGGTGPIYKVAGKTNQLRCASLAWADDTSVFPHSAILGDRGVKVGDAAKVRALVSSNYIEVDTTITGFLPDITPALTPVASADPNNAAGQSASTAISQIAGGLNCVVATANGAAYSGLASGFLTETYTIKVATASNGGDLTTARLRVISGSGTDDQLSVQPSASGSPTNIGTRGLTVTWNNTSQVGCSSFAAAEGIPAQDFVVGQVWTVTVSQAYTVPTITGGGTFTGPTDLTYIIKVVKGGIAPISASSSCPACPLVQAVTTTGIDVSGPTVVTAQGAAVAIGSFGATITFTESGGQVPLRKGDTFVLTCVAAKPGYNRTLVLANDLPSAVIDNEEVELTLYIQEQPGFILPQNRLEAPPNHDWTQSSTQICTKAGATAFDPTWTISGVPVALPVAGGNLFVQFRAWRADTANVMGSVTNSTLLSSTIQGPLTPDNPIAYGVLKALENAQGVPVNYVIVANPTDPNSWVAALNAIEDIKTAYGLVPLSRDATVIGEVIAHVSQQSSPLRNRWRDLWLAGTDVPIQGIVNPTPPVLATVSASSGTNYNLLRAAAGTGLFLTRGVQPGDTVRYLYTSDGFGNVVYSTFVVAQVLTEDSLLLTTSLGAPVGVAQMVQIWRTLTPEAEATAIGQLAGAYANRRIMWVWPDQVPDGGVLVDGMFLACALAGLASGVLPQQGLTHVTVAGFDNMDRTTKKFNRDQLNTMAGSGVWIVTQDHDSGAIFNRHAVTTASTDDINQREESITRNLDNISFQFLALWDPFIGKTNVSSLLLNKLNGLLREKLNQLTSSLSAAFDDLGPQVVSYSDATVIQSPTLRDHVLINSTLLLPYALDVVDHTITVS